MTRENVRKATKLLKDSNFHLGKFVKNFNPLSSSK